MNKYLRISVSVLLITAVIAGIALSQNKRLFDEEVAYYTELADSEVWCFLVQQPENHTWAFHKEYYNDVITEWERVTRIELRTQIAEHHDWKHGEYPSVIIIRIVESDRIIFFFHTIPDSPDAGVTYWKP